MTFLRRTRALIHKGLFVTVVFILVPLFSFGDEQISRQDGLIAALYLDNAVDQFNGGFYSSAKRLVDAAISFDSNLSDAEYLKARLLVKDKKYINSIKDAKIALKLNNFKYFNPVDASIFLSRIQFLTADTTSAYSNLLPFWNKISLKANYAELFVNVADVLGKYDTALKMAREFPGTGFSQKLLVERDFVWRRRAVFQILDGDVSKFYTKEAYRAIIQRTPEPYFSKLMHLYSKRWGEDRFYLINSLGLQGTPVLSVLKELFANGVNPEIKREDIKRIKQLLDLKKIKYNAKAFFADKSFTILDDTNRDSFTDIKTVIENGFPVSVSFDMNQDGNPEYKVFFSKSTREIEKITINKEDKISIQYLPYPYITTYKKEDGGIKTSYAISPHSLKFKVVEVPKDPVLNTFKIDPAVSLPSGFALKVNSSSFNEVNSELGEKIDANRVNIHDTLVSLLNEEGKKFKKLTFAGTAITNGEQDIDGDGIADLFFKYKDGEISSLSFDGNHNGKFEYKEIYLPKWERKWDLDDDGIFDVEEYFDNGVKVRKFSTRMDGIFDYTERRVP